MKKSNSFLLQLKEDSSIYIIDSVDDFKNAPLKSLDYLDRKTLDFEKLSQDYDALWLTRKGESDTRWDMEFSLYGWDCESVLVMNPYCVTQVEEVHETHKSFPVYQYLH